MKKEYKSIRLKIGTYTLLKQAMEESKIKNKSIDDFVSLMLLFFDELDLDPARKHIHQLPYFELTRKMDQMQKTINLIKGTLKRSFPEESFKAENTYKGEGALLRKIERFNDIAEKIYQEQRNQERWDKWKEENPELWEAKQRRKK